MAHQTNPVHIISQRHSTVFVGGDYIQCAKTCCCSPLNMNELLSLLSRGKLELLIYSFSFRQYCNIYVFVGGFIQRNISKRKRCLLAKDRYTMKTIACQNDCAWARILWRIGKWQEMEKRRKGDTFNIICILRRKICASYDKINSPCNTWWYCMCIYLFLCVCFLLLCNSRSVNVQSLSIFSYGKWSKHILWHYEHVQDIR